MSKCNIVAVVTLSAEVPFPKKKGVKSGYSPHHKFPNVEYLVSGFHVYADDQLHYPGETLLVEILFPSWEFFGGNISVGDNFSILELERLVGEGVVQSIVQGSRS
ncbi:hypothetical protein [Pseudomonas tohonis]|uniref:hypothetical protein n=1 Tax=Pseudomonas tohonis TaxID=2725477 RepID=UPI001F15A091|nr:hypothetical protein [Pseudomonas tohonis]